MSDPTDEFDAPGDAADEFAPEAAIEDARGPAADEVPVEAEAIESDAAESVEPVEPVAPAEFVEPAEPAEPVESAPEPAQPVEVAAAAEFTQAVEFAAAAEPGEAVEIREPLEFAAEPVDPVAAFRDEMAAAPGDWYVIHSYAGYENKVKANLLTRVTSLNMEDYIFQVEVPIEEVVEIKNGQKKLVKRNKFPGYVLVRMDLTDESWGTVRHTPGVTGFVGHAHQPLPLSLEEVVAILAPEPVPRRAASPRRWSRSTWRPATRSPSSTARSPRSTRPCPRSTSRPRRSPAWWRSSAARPPSSCGSTRSRRTSPEDSRGRSRRGCTQTKDPKKCLPRRRRSPA